MNLDHLFEIGNKSKDFIELYRLLSEFTIFYKKLLDDYISDDEFNSNNNLKESVSDIFKKIDDIRTDIDFITHFIVR